MKASALGALTALLGLLPTAAVGSPAPPTQPPAGLTALTARYEVFTDGRPNGESVMQLRPLAADRWEWRVESRGTRGLAKWVAVHSLQRAEFEWRDGQPHLLLAESETRSALHHRRDRLRVDWTTQRLHWDGDLPADRAREQPFDGAPSCAALLNLQLGLDSGRSSAAEFSYEVHDRGRGRRWNYQRLPATMLTVPLGRFEAVALQHRRADKPRLTTLWFSPELPPLPLRVLRQENGRDRFELRLLELQSDRVSPR